VRSRLFLAQRRCRVDGQPTTRGEETRQDTRARHHRNELTPANGPQDFFNTVANPTRVALMGAVWNSTLSPHALLETRLGYNRISQTLDVNNKIDPASLGINTGPLDPADFGVPVVTLGTFGAIGGTGVYPLSTTPTETWDVSTALTETRGQHTIKMGGNWQLGRSHSIGNNARSTFTVTEGTLDDVDSLVGLLAASTAPAGALARRIATCHSNRSRPSSTTSGT
jgi:hypothetical protein